MPESAASIPGYSSTAYLSAYSVVSAVPYQRYQVFNIFLGSFVYVLTIIPLVMATLFKFSWSRGFLFASLRSWFSCLQNPERNVEKRLAGQNRQRLPIKNPL